MDMEEKLDQLSIQAKILVDSKTKAQQEYGEACKRLEAALQKVEIVNQLRDATTSGQKTKKDLESTLLQLRKREESTESLHTSLINQISAQNDVTTKMEMELMEVQKVNEEQKAQHESVEKRLVDEMKVLQYELEFTAEQVDSLKSQLDELESKKVIFQQEQRALKVAIRREAEKVGRARNKWKSAIKSASHELQQLKALEQEKTKEEHSNKQNQFDMEAELNRK